MGVSFTDDQLKVIETRNKNILVSAAAGSGKTAVLTERIIQKVCDSENPVSIDKVLIVTFTEAAASEMRERIAKALDDLIEKDPDNIYLQKQKSLLPLSLITTIDSFCLYLLHNHFQEIGLDPSFRIGDEGELKLIKKDCLDALIEKQCNEAGEEFFECEECFDPNANFQKVGDLILEIHKFVQSMPFPEDWFEEQLADTSRNLACLDKEAFMEYLISYEESLLEDCIDCARRSIECCELPGGPIQYKAALESDLEFLLELAKADFSQRSQLLSAHSFDPLGRRKKDMGEEDSELKDLVKGYRDDIIKGTIGDLYSKYHSQKPEELLMNQLSANRITHELIRLSYEFSEAFKAAKAEARIVDFSDLEHFALQILLRKGENGNYEKTAVALSYQDFFEEIMVDEYQDSNDVQELLLESISKQNADSGNRFMVGDVKQSIYRFRLARPEIFMSKYNSFPKSDNHKDIRIDLSMNFRSRKSVLDSVNRTFEPLMYEKIGGVLYDEAAHLNNGLKYTYLNDKMFKTELLCLDSDMVSDSDEDKIDLEAKAIASRIKELYGTFVVSGKDGNPRLKEDGSFEYASYKDMVILLRTASGVDTHFKEVLEAEGIPVFVPSRNGYFNAKEIKQVLNYLSVLSNPRQDIPLTSVMTSYFAGFSDSDIAQIRVGSTKGELLWDSVLKYLSEGTDPFLVEKVSAFVNEINDYRDLSKTMSVSELLTEILEKKDYMNYISALPGGEKRRGNLILLKQRAANYEITGYSGISDFIRYIEGMKEMEVDFGEANLLDETADVVRIMTIHKSKGLEFPICFVAGMGKKFNTSDSKKEVSIDSDLGISGVCFDLNNRTKQSSIKLKASKLKKSIDARGEDLRVLYVAMTRAREKLILSGVGNLSLNADLDGRSFYMDEILSAQNFMRLLIPVAKNNPDLFEINEVDVNLLDLNEKAERIAKNILKEQLRDIEPAQFVVPPQYPHKSLEGLFVKTTVSELKKERLEEEIGEFQFYQREDEDELIPQFLNEKEVRGTRRGNAYHRVMELMDFTISALGLEEKKQRLNELRKEKIDIQMISASEYDLVEEGKIISFLDTELALRMGKAQSAGVLYLEQPFVLSLKADEIDNIFPENERILVQGVIDAYFEENGEIVLLDYKTDRVKDAEELVSRYQTQLDYYAEAIERLEGKKVKEKLIYSFALGKVVEI